MKKCLISIFSLFLITTSAWADHEPDHRYTIQGFVLDENEKAMPDVSVGAYEGSKLIRSINTGGDGYYSLQLHLHDPDYGKKLNLRAGQSKADITVEFDVQNKHADRLHHANFVGGKLVEGKISRFRMPVWIYPLAGLIALFIGAYFLEKRRQAKIKLAKRAEHEKHGAPKHKSKKAKRKKG